MKPVTGPSQRRQPQPETDTSSEALPGPPEVNLQYKYTQVSNIVYIPYISWSFFPLCCRYRLALYTY
jgi:hypothetical protein